MAVTRALLLALLLLAVAVSGQTFNGNCPDIPPVSDFDHQRFVSGTGNGSPGLWFTYRARGFPPGRRCKAEFQYALSGGRIQFHGQFVQTSDNVMVETNGTLTPFQEGVAYFNVTTTDLPNPLSFKIIASDYENYGIFFHCANHMEGEQMTNTQILFIFTRQRNPQSVQLPATTRVGDLEIKSNVGLLSVIGSKLVSFNREFGLDVNFTTLKKIDQDNCPELTRPSMSTA